MTGLAVAPPKAAAKPEGDPMDDALLVWAERGGLPTDRRHDLPTVLDHAVTYTLGRMTYAVSDVTRALIRHRHQLTPDHRAALADRIDARIAAGLAGMDADARDWSAAADALRTEAA